MVRPGPPHRTGLRTGSEGARGEGRRGRPGGLRIRSSPRRPGPPGSRGPAVGSSQAADQMGIARRTRGRSLSPARPIPATEGSDRRAANTRGSARAGRGCLRATSARGGCGSRGVTAGGGRARNRGPRGRTQTLRPGPGSRCRMLPTRPTCCAGGRSEPWASGASAAAASPGTGRGAQGGVPFTG